MAPVFQGDLVLRLVTTGEDLVAALSVRKRVFIDEQGVSPELEIDEYDVLAGETQHVVAVIDQQVVGAGRLRPVEPDVAKLERIAVLAAYRGRGIGVALTQHLETLAQQLGFTQLTMNAQQSAFGFYQKLGYVAEGERFLEAGIMHQRMTKTWD
jgi:predicted GNAT family N-acyltransferase